MQQAIRQETHTSVCVGIITTQAADLRTMLRTRDESFLVHHGLGLAWGAVEVGGAARCFCSLFPSLKLFGFSDSDSEKSTCVSLSLHVHVSLALSRPALILKLKLFTACGACGAALVCSYIIYSC